MPELKFIAARGQLGVMRAGHPSVWFDCPAVDAFEAAQYVCRKHGAKMESFDGLMGISAETEKTGALTPANPSATTTRGRCRPTS